MRQPFLRPHLVLVFLTLAVLAGGWRPCRAAPLARDGVLDLESLDIARDGPVRLDGEWDWYRGRLLSPEDFQPGRPAPEKTGTLVLPGSWEGRIVDGREIDGTGFATLRLRVLPGPGEKRLELRLFDVQSAFRLWANGEPLAEGGRVGESAAAEQPDPSFALPLVTTDGRPLDLLLQISNHHSRRGGVPTSILLATPGPLALNHARAWGGGLFFAGSLLVMGVYHLVLYVWRRRDASPLYFGLYCLLWMGNFLTSNVTEWAIYLFVSGTPSPVLDRISMVFYIVSVPVGYRFFRSLYPLEFSRLMQHACDASAIVFGLIVMACPSLVVYSAISYCYLTSIFFIGYSFYRLYRCLRRGLDGALFILCGFVFLGLVAINDMLYHMGFIHSVFLIQTGLFVFVLSQALALAQRFSHAFAAVERLSVALEQGNAALRAEMAERGRLEREVVSISDAERRRLSHELHDGLCQQLTGARLRCAVLGQQLAGTADAEALARLGSLLDASVDGAYDLSRGLWPVEHGPDAAGPSLDDLVRRVAAGSGIAVELRREGACATCAIPQATPLFRIAQEALANAVKHARAGRIRVTLSCRPPEGLVLTVADDGIGRAAAGSSRGGLGLGIMAHRARIIGATLAVADAPGGGTVVTCAADCGGHCALAARPGPGEASDDGR